MNGKWEMKNEKCEMTGVFYEGTEQERGLREEISGIVGKKAPRLDCSGYRGGITCGSMADNQDITPAILLQHMQGMERRIMQHMDARFAQVDSRFSLMDKRFDAIDARLSKLERKVELLSVQIGNLDERLDDLEVVKVPMLQKAVGIGGKAER